MTTLKAEGPFKKATCEEYVRTEKKDNDHREEAQDWSHIKDVKEED